MTDGPTHECIVCGAAYFGKGAAQGCCGLAQVVTVGQDD